MSREPRLKWKPRDPRLAKVARPATSPLAVAILIAIAVITSVAVLYRYHQQGERHRDGHVIALTSTASGFTGPFEKGRIDLRFVDIAGRRHARLALTEADGARSVLPPSAIIRLEFPASSGRSQITFRDDGRAIVSERPVGRIAERATLVIDEGRFRHVYALEVERDR